MNISRNKITGEIAQGNLGISFTVDPWVSCIDENGKIKDSEKKYIESWKLDIKKEKKKEKDK